MRSRRPLLHRRRRRTAVVRASAAVLPLLAHALTGIAGIAGIAGPTPGDSGGGATGAATVGGWYAGATGEGVLDGRFADWLGQPVGIVGTWNDTTDEVQRTQPSLTGELADWSGALDIAVAGTVLGSGESYAEAARGDYDDRWRQAADVIAAARRRATGATFVRPWHEMNGDWYREWAVTAETLADYRAAFRRYVTVLREALPEVYVAWSPNDGTHQNLPVSRMYPGDDVVDVIAPDSYDWTGSAEVDAAGIRRYLERSGPGGEPEGLETWRRFADEHGKPLALPEWGLCHRPGCGGDHPAYIEVMNAWMAEHATPVTWPLGEPIPAEAAGTVLYSIYFNTVHHGENGFLIHGGPNPVAEALFPDLAWGLPARGLPRPEPAPDPAPDAALDPAPAGADEIANTAGGWCRPATASGSATCCTSRQGIRLDTRGLADEELIEHVGP